LRPALQKETVSKVSQTHVTLDEIVAAGKQARPFCRRRRRRQLVLLGLAARLPPSSGTGAPAHLFLSRVMHHY
jgi:hypothetical protein